MDTLAMARRRFLLIAAGAAAAGLSGCGSRASSASTPDAAYPSAPPINVSPAASARDAGPAARAALTGFGVDFLRGAMEVKPAAATGISPYSLFAVLSMVRAGAAGQTAEQIDVALKATGSQAQGAVVTAVETGMAAALDAAAASVAASGEPVVLQAANQAWADQGLRVHPSYLDALARDFGTTARLADFAGDPEGTREAINTWVAERTHDLIPELFPQGTIGADTRVVLVNALYLKAQWLNAFSPRKDGPFTTADRRQLTVPLMTTEQAVPGFAGAGWSAATLPYSGSGLGMTVVVPDAGIADALDNLPAIVEAVATAEEATQTAVTLPVFSLRSELDAQGIARQLGITDLFGDADLSGISDEVLSASAFVHQCVVKVDEKGTEAAAATGIAMIESASVSSEHLVVDRPFLFWIADSTTGAPLFLGVVNEPTTTA